MAKQDPSSSRPSHEEIAILAYQMYEEEGRPHGRHQEHWNQAELLLITRNLQSASDKKQASSKSDRQDSAEA